MSNEENARLYRLECKVDFLFQRLGIDPEVALVRDSDGLGGLPTSFHEALRLGKTIEAIKIYREATGADLKTAKNAVDGLSR